MIQRVRGLFQEFGPVGGLCYLVHRALRFVSKSCGLFRFASVVQPVADSALLPARIASRYSHCELEHSNALVLDMPMRPEVRRARLTQQTKCLGVFKDGELVGYLWFAREQYLEDQIRCRYRMLPSGVTVFDFDVFVVPKQRGGFTFAAIWNEANEYLRSKGVSHSFSRIDLYNQASLRAHEKLGAIIVENCLVLKLWQIELMFCGQAPRIRMTGPTSSIPTIILEPPVSIP